MVNKKVFLRISLLVFTGISCSLVSRVFSTAEPAEAEQPESYSFGVPSTLPTPTLRVESQIEKALQKSEPDDPSIPILCEHRVAFSETLECIGRGYGVIPEMIADTNGIGLTSELEVGQELLIPAVPWENISDGSVCLPQCIPPDWDLGITEATGSENNGGEAGSSTSGNNGEETGSSTSGNNGEETGSSTSEDSDGRTGPYPPPPPPPPDDCSRFDTCPGDKPGLVLPDPNDINPPLPFDPTTQEGCVDPGECLNLPIIVP